MDEPRGQGIAQLAERVEAAEAGAELVRVELLNPCGEPEARHVREQWVVRGPGPQKEPPPELARPRARRQVRVEPIEQARPRGRLRLPQAELADHGLLAQVVAVEHLAGALTP